MTPNQLKNSILQLAIQGKLVEQRPEEGTAEELLKHIQAEKQRLISEGKLKKDKNESIIFKRGNSYFEIIGTTEKCIDDELPFEIPDTWRWARLNDLSVLIGDGIHGTPIFDENGIYYFVNGNNLVNGKIIIKSDTKKVNETEYIKYKKNINENTVLLSINGTIGNIAYYNNEPIILGKSAAYITLFPSMVKDYISIILKSTYFLEYATNKATQTTIKNVSLKAMRDLPIPLPPLAEQQRIVAKIEELLPMVEKYGEAYNKLETLNKSFPAEIKKSILQYAIQSKLTESWRLSVKRKEIRDERLEECLANESSSYNRHCEPAESWRGNPDLLYADAETLLKTISEEKEALIKQGKLKKDKNESTIIKRGNSYFEKVGTTEKCINDELPFEIPDSWLWVKLDELAIKEIRRGKSPKYAEKGSAFAFAQKCNSKHEGIKLDLALYLDDSSLKRYSEEEAIIDKDIIINSTGTGTLGRIGFYKESFNVLKAKYYPDSHVTVLRVSKNILPEFVFACLKYHHPWLEKQGEGSTNQKELKPHTIKNLPIPLPPPAEQKAIVSKIEQLFKLVDKLS